MKLIKTNRMYVKLSLVAFAAIFSVTTVMAQHGHYRHGHLCTAAYRRPVVNTVVVRPAVINHVSNRFSKKDRMDMAIGWLKNNDKPLTVRKYSNITGLTTDAAEAELDAFALDRRNPIKVMKNGKKKVYTLG